MASESRRVKSAVQIWIREQLRGYVLMALLVLFPVYGVLSTNHMMPDQDAPLWVEFDGIIVTELVAMADVYTVLMASLGCALPAGLIGMFSMQKAAKTDSRLIIAGYRIHEVVLARFLTLGAFVMLVGVVTSIVSFQFVDPWQPAVFVTTLVLVALLYGLVGMIVGAIMDPLPGLYVVFFGSILDIRVFQDPQVVRDDPSAISTALPGHFPTQTLFDATVVDVVPWVDIAWTIVYVWALALVVLAILYRRSAAST